MVFYTFRRIGAFFENYIIRYHLRKTFRNIRIEDYEKLNDFLNKYHFKGFKSLIFSKDYEDNKNNQDCFLYKRDGEAFGLLYGEYYQYTDDFKFFYSLETEKELNENEINELKIYLNVDEIIKEENEPIINEIDKINLYIDKKKFMKFYLIL